MPSKVKIIATIGPSSMDEEIIYSMAYEGVNGFRVNFSHGDRDLWDRIVEAVRKAEEKIGKPLALIGDLQGPSVRVGLLKEPLKLKKGKQVEIIYSRESGGDKIPVPVQKFFDVVEEGDRLLMDDGKISFVVEEVYSNRVLARALTEGVITSRKALVIKGKEVPLPAITSKDLNDIEYAIKRGFDYIALSYVKSAEDVRMLRRILYERNAREIGIIAKIETVSGVRNLNEILDETDVVLVARGDLGMHFSLEEIPWLQRTIIRKSIEKGKPVIVATQILASMAEYSTPTRAEVVDVVTAMSEGADALMLTGETAVGKYPLETVKWLRKIIEKYEDRISYPREEPGKTAGVKQRFAYSIVVLAEELGAKIAVYTKEGKTALRITRYHPRTIVYASSNNPRVLRKLSIIWGVEPVKVEAGEYSKGIEETYKVLIEKEEVGYGDLLVLTYGIREAEHTIKIVRVEKIF